MSRPTITFQVYSPIDYGDQQLHDETVTKVWIFKPTLHMALTEYSTYGRNRYTNEPIMFMCTSSNLMLTPHPDSYIVWHDMEYPVKCNAELYTIVNDLALELELMEL